MGSRVQARERLSAKGSPKNQQQLEDGRHLGKQSLAPGKVSDAAANHGEGVWGQAGPLLLEEISAPNPGQGDCKGIRYLCNLLDSVVTLAARKAKENGQKNILSEISGRDLGMQIGNPVPEASNQTHS